MILDHPESSATGHGPVTSTDVAYFCLYGFGLTKNYPPATDEKSSPPHEAHPHFLCEPVEEDAVVGNVDVDRGIHIINCFSAGMVVRETYDHEPAVTIYRAGVDPGESGCASTWVDMKALLSVMIPPAGSHPSIYLIIRPAPLPSGEVGLGIIAFKSVCYLPEELRRAARDTTMVIGLEPGMREGPRVFRCEDLRSLT